MMTSTKSNRSDQERVISENDFGHVWTPEEWWPVFAGANYPKPYIDFNKWATPDTIRHFADGIGDLNPMYRDEEYATQTKYKRLIAPPCWLFSVEWGTAIIYNETGAQGFEFGGETEWFRPICAGDEYTWKFIFPTKTETRQSKGGVKVTFLYSDCEFIRQGNETVGIRTEWVASPEPPPAAEAEKMKALMEKNAKTPPVPVHEYSVEDLKEIYAAQDREVVRGAEPRYWEDVVEGDELTPVVRGPYSMNEALAWLIGCGGILCRSDRLLRMPMERAPKIGILDPATKVLVNPNMPHLDPVLARRTGTPSAYDYGRQRTAWAAMMMTNWMGDDGFLWKLRTEYHGMNLVGDTMWIRGKVVRKYSDEGKYCADIEFKSENQRHERTMRGTATVILPSREHGPVIYPEPRHIA